MKTPRRDFLMTAFMGAGATAIHSVWTRLAAAAQNPAGAAGSVAILAQVQADLERHAAFGDKLSGSSGDNATAEWIAGRLRGSGYDVNVSEFDAPYYVGRTGRFTVGKVSAEISAQPVVITTGTQGLSAPVALVENQVGNVQGRIALFVLPPGRHAALFPDRGIGRTVKQIAEAGAVAIVIVTSGPSGEVGFLNVPLQPFVPVPLALLAPKHAAPLVEAARSGGTATLVIEGDSTRRPCQNIVGRIKKDDRWIVLSTPRSGWGPCVAERGTGTAAFLELAAWAPRAFPDVSVFVMNTGGHEYFFAGSHEVVDQAPPPEKTLVWAHIGATLGARAAQEVDGKLVMLDTPDPGGSVMATDEVRAAAAAGFAGLGNLARPGAVRPGAGELGDFTQRGYKTAFAMIATHSWFHTAADTLERTNASLVVPILEAHRKTIELLVAGR